VQKFLLSLENYSVIQIIGVKMKEIIYEIFSDILRQGPGDDEYTRKAFHIIPALPPKPVVVDVGCGTGAQTMELARICYGNITGVDNYKPYIDQLNEKLKKEELDNASAIVGDMFDLNFDDESVDLIWSEGAIYIMGFENGLIQWEKYLKPGGFIVISEIAWLEEHRPEEVQKFWDEEVPGMLMPDEQKQIINDCGYELLESFSLPKEAWERFYSSVQDRVDKLRLKYEGNGDSLASIESVQNEINIFHKYNDYFGYIYYIMRKKEPE
jgi:ubiquinone/menaquinone biosynthesis C-methylase UbiE